MWRKYIVVYLLLYFSYWIVVSIHGNITASQQVYLRYWTLVSRQ